MPAPEVDAVDTLAAGDVWHGAFTSTLGEGRPVAAAARFANTAAALKCTRFGGRRGRTDAVPKSRRAGGCPVSSYKTSI